MQEQVNEARTEIRLLPKIKSNGSVRFSGLMLTEWKFSHEFHGKAFHKATMSIKRKSGTEDYIPLIISERILGAKDHSNIGKHVSMIGNIRTRNYDGEDGKRHMQLYVYVTDFQIDEEETINLNDVQITGAICREPIYRKTTLGREITELCIAISYSGKCMAYVPCIAWGKCAQMTRDAMVGTIVEIEGRFQSREYLARGEEHVTHEVSCMRVKLLANKNEAMLTCDSY